MDAELREHLGEWTDPIVELGTKLSEMALVVLGSALGKQATIVDPLVAPTAADEIVDEFGVLPHIGMEIRVALSETEAYLGALLVTIDDAKTLLGTAIESGDEVALKNAQKTASEVADLLGLMLFTDTAIVGEIKVAEARFDGIAETLGMVADVAAGAQLARMEFDIAESDGDVRSRLTIIVPVTVMQRIAEGLSSKATAAATPPASAGPTGAASNVQSMDALLGAGLAGSLGDEDPEIDVHAARFVPFENARRDGSAGHGLDLIQDVSLRVAVELGRTVMTVHDVLGLGPGSVVELDKLAGEPVDILVNDRIVARGEVVVVDENFGVRVTEIVSAARKPLPVN